MGYIELIMVLSGVLPFFSPNILAIFDPMFLIWIIHFTGILSVVYWLGSVFLTDQLYSLHKKKSNKILKVVRKVNPFEDYCLSTVRWVWLCPTSLLLKSHISIGKQVYLVVVRQVGLLSGTSSFSKPRTVAD
jgi:hypothetical protein